MTRKTLKGDTSAESFPEEVTFRIAEKVFELVLCNSNGLV